MSNHSDEAKQALQGIEAAAGRAKRVALYKGPDIIYMIWGFIWTTCFVLQQFAGTVDLGAFRMPVGGLAWNVMVPMGIILTLVLGRQRFAVKSSSDWAIGILWGTLFLYAGLFSWLVAPLIDVRVLVGPDAAKRVTAMACLVPMSGYVVMGLFGFGRYMMWLGLTVTLATVVGLHAFGDWFFLWMAISGGGALFAAGIITRREWRKA